VEGRKRNVRPFSPILIASVDVPREFISVRMRKKEKKETRPACEAQQPATKISRDQRPELRTVNISSFALSLLLSLLWAARLFAGDSSIAITVDRAISRPCPSPCSPRLVQSSLGSFSRDDFYRVNEVSVPFYNRRGRSPDDDSNNCRAYSRSIGRSASPFLPPPPRYPMGPALTAARPGPGCLPTSMETRGWQW